VERGKGIPKESEVYRSSRNKISRKAHTRMKLWKYVQVPKEKCIGGEGRVCAREDIGAINIKVYTQGCGLGEDVANLKI